MFETIFGLPLHPLVVHAVVVFLPVAALAVVVAALWPRFRRWAGPLPLGLAVIGAALTPVATESGEYLEHVLGARGVAAVQTHAELGDITLYWALGQVLAAALVFWWLLQTREGDNKRQPSRPLVLAIITIAVVASAGSLAHIIRVGDSGARAAWGYVADLK